MSSYCTKYREKLELVLQESSFKLNSSEKVGIVGWSGNDPSSLVLGLVRIIEPTSGKFEIENASIKKIGLLDLKSRITIIPQNPVLFSGTLRFNLDPYGTYSDEQIWSALDLVKLKDFVGNTVDGLLLPLDEGGDNLSVGQKQLVCFARAILQKSAIIILDEATAAIDLETDASIQRALKEHFSHCIILTIAHRINTVMDYDKILVINNGRVVEFDKPKNLLSDCNSTFFNLAKKDGLV